MGKKDKKDKKKGKGAEKTLAKEAKNAEKRARRDEKKAGGGGDEEDLEKIIARFRKLDEDSTKVEEEAKDGPPSTRINSSLSTHPSKDELFVFGGEYWNGDLVHFYGNFYRYAEKTAAWSEIISSNAPPPRSSHQAVSMTVRTEDLIYIFGGEYANEKQTKFYHYKDMWCFHIKENRWEEIKTKKLPSARSGHRMAAWKNNIVLFGGFYDTIYQTQYMNDTWIFDCIEQKWRELTFPPVEVLPPKRSGCGVLVYADTLYVYGGYSKEKKKKGEDSRGIVHQDLWSLNLNAPPNGHRWVKCKRSGIPPSQRSGFSLTLCKKRAIVFGGVQDIEHKDGRIESEFFNNIFSFNLENKRWFPLNLKKPKGPKRAKKDKKQDEHAQQQTGQASSKKYQDSDSEDEDNEFAEYMRSLGLTVDGVALENASEVEKKAEVVQVEEEKPQSIVEKPEEKVPVSEEPAKSLSQKMMELNQNEPCPRINAQIACRGNTIYLYGGMFEIEDREVTMSDMWSIDVSKMEKYVHVVETNDLNQEWCGSESESESESDPESEEDSEDDSEEESGAEDEDEEGDTHDHAAGDAPVSVDDVDVEIKEDSETTSSSKAAKKKGKAAKEKAQSLRNRRAGGRMEMLRDQLGMEDTESTPKVSETLADFFTRTTAFWKQMAWENNIDGSNDQKDEKYLRKQGFGLARERYRAVEPILRELAELEAEMKESDAKSKKENQARKAKLRR